MPQFATSGTTGVPRTYTITEEQIARRIAHMNDASCGIGFEALKSIFIDWAPDAYFGIVYTRYAEQHGMNAYHATQGSVEAMVEFFKSENIQGITSTPQNLPAISATSMRRKTCWSWTAGEPDSIQIN